MQLIRYKTATGEIAVGLTTDEKYIAPVAPMEATPTALHDLMHLHADELRVYLQQVTRLSLYNQEKPLLAQHTLLAPIDGETEVWAAGVTYKRSEEARREESDTPDIYSRVYSASRPELFFKANARRVSGTGGPIAIRSDSTWDVPEPELVLAINVFGEIIGYSIGNDVSSRSIEGENPLYLPQAKVYAGCCALGPGITPVWEIADPYKLTMRMTIERGGQKLWKGKTSIGKLHRKLPELVDYLYREDEFPHGALLSTGTALVPELPFTLEAGDIVEISIDQLGTLRNPVVRGKAAHAEACKAL